MNILAIDTSCDETSVAVTSGTQVLSNVISSQVRYHKKYGGVVPFLAQRLHRERIDAVIALALARADLDWSGIDAIAVTYGPGLAPALEVGLQKARDLAAKYRLPLYGVNHMAGHIASCFPFHDKAIEYPALALLVSGGHTELVRMQSFADVEVVGQTLDDALGEAYDKVSKMLGLGYPGGRLLSKLAKSGNSQAYSLPIPLQYSKDLNFSYSGLKNAVRLVIEEMKAAGPIRQKQICDLAASFQEVAQVAVEKKVRLALREYPDTRIVLMGGGVAANTVLRARIRKLGKEFRVPLVVPARLNLCSDNAAMIGVAAYFGIQAGQQPVLPELLDRKPGLALGQAS